MNNTKLGSSAGNSQRSRCTFATHGQEELRGGEEIARCPSCSLYIMVIYNPVRPCSMHDSMGDACMLGVCNLGCCCAAAASIISSALPLRQEPAWLPCFLLQQPAGPQHALFLLGSDQALAFMNLHSYSVCEKEQ